MNFIEKTNNFFLNCPYINFEIIERVNNYCQESMNNKSVVTRMA